MKASYKAALLSALVLPGAGQLYLKRYWRGLGIMCFAFAGLGYVIWSATLSALKLLDDAMVRAQGGATNIKALSEIVGSTTSAADPYRDAVFSGILCVWIFAVIDAYRIGKKNNSSE